MKIYIHVNQHKIRANLKNGTNDPVISIKRGKKIINCHKVKILGPSEVISSDKPLLSCGARVAIVTESDLLVDWTV